MVRSISLGCLALSGLVLPLVAVSSSQSATPPEQPLATGPARICLIHTGIALAEDEVASLDYVGIHSRGLRVTGPAGSFAIREGTWVVPRTRGRAVHDPHGRRIVRYGGRRRPRYLFFIRSEPESGEWPSVWVEGGALDGSAHDRAILARIDVQLSDPARCARRIGAD